MNLPRLKTSLSGIVFGATVAGALSGAAFCSTLADGTQQDGTINGLPLAGANRPESVPEGYVITPFGYFHPSCVQGLAEGETLLADGRIQHADGSVGATGAICSYPRFTPEGVLVTTGSSSSNTPQTDNASQNASSQINGWVENGYSYINSTKESYGALIATWIVPAQPSADDGQSLGLFPGFEDGNVAVGSILQPVLQWHGGQWAIASWNCCFNGVTTHSRFVNVTSGDEIYGSITSDCLPGTLSCAKWDVLALDMSTGQSTTLSNTPSKGQAFNWAFGGALEVYSLGACDEYPSDGQISFEKIELFDQDLKPISNPTWVNYINVSPGTKPQCGYAVTHTATSLTLTY